MKGPSRLGNTIHGLWLTQDKLCGVETDEARAVLRYGLVEAGGSVIIRDLAAGYRDIGASFSRATTVR